jgi:PAS domain S-box-containing protein
MYPMEHCRELLEALPYAALIADPTGRVLHINAEAARLFGRTGGALLGNNVDMLLSESDRGPYQDRRTMIFAHAKGSGVRLALEARGRRRDGTEFPLEISLSILETEQGPFALNVVRDLTEIRRLQRSLLDSTRVKSEFFSHMSHELRTPLNGIIGFAEFLLEGKPGPLNPEQQEYLGDVLDSGRRLMLLIDEFVELSRLESGALDLRAEAFPLAAALEEVCAAGAIAAKARQISLHCAIEPGLCTVMLDRRRLLQVLNYLIANAIRFSGPGREVHLSAGIQGEDGLSLCIWDAGANRRSAEMEQLLTDYPQLEASAIRRYGSKGLDLVLARKIVEAQRGLFSIESLPGRGNAFRIILPCVFVTAEAPSERIDSALP